MRAVDTNVLVRLIARDHPKQTAAAEQFVSQGAWLSHVVLAEAIWVLSSVYELDDTEIAKAVELLLGHEHLVLQDSDVVVASLDRFRAATAVSFTDCLILESARKAGHVPLGTFDKDLSKLSGAQKL